MSDTLVAVLASGEGTTAEAFIRACAEGGTHCAVGLVISSSDKAPVLGRVKALNRELGTTVATACIGRSTHPPAAGESVGNGEQSAAEAAAIGRLLTEGGFELVVLMGYLRRVSPGLVHSFGWRPEYVSPYEARMVNIHPGPLPETKGLYGTRVQERVLEIGLGYAAHVVHVVADGYDEGPVVFEHRTPLSASDTPDTLSERIRAMQRAQVPADIAEFARRRRASALAGDLAAR
jgi:phosphoribosylglycinamide formyltransferase-1